jgi:hypothetical protein
LIPFLIGIGIGIGIGIVPHLTIGEKPCDICSIPNPIPTPMKAGAKARQEIMIIHLRQGYGGQAIMITITIMIK